MKLLADVRALYSCIYCTASAETPLRWWCGRPATREWPVRLTRRSCEGLEDVLQGSWIQAAATIKAVLFRKALENSLLLFFLLKTHTLFETKSCCFLSSLNGGARLTSPPSLCLYHASSTCFLYRTVQLQTPTQSPEECLVQIEKWRGNCM